MNENFKNFAYFAVNEMKKSGIDYGDIRIAQTKNDRLQLKNSDLDIFDSSIERGFGVRVLEKGSWGFSSFNELNEHTIKNAINEAQFLAKQGTSFVSTSWSLKKVNPVKGYYKTKVKIDPETLPLEKKIEFLTKITDQLNIDKKIIVRIGFLLFKKINKLFYSTEGHEIEQDIYISEGGFRAFASDSNDIQWRSYPADAHGIIQTGGFEVIEECEFERHTGRIANEALELLKAPPCPTGIKTILLAPSMMVIQLHESCGHPIELDRVLGEEISLAGSSFLTVDKLNNFQYGSPIVNIYADNLTERGAGSFGFDDEGSPQTKVDIVKDGKFVGYLSSRETASRINTALSGNMRADSPLRLPIIRMTNINLAPGNTKYEDMLGEIKDGLLLTDNKSWSIDDKRLNFQFGAELAYEIKNGKIGQIYKNPIYTGITPEFWRNCTHIADINSWKMWGVANCGKGDPMQTMYVGHGVSPAVFKNVQVGATLC
jgi:TldD protein